VLNPVGPLPASVYWRRRALAFAGVIVLLLLGWAILPGGGNDQPRDTAAAAGSPSPTVPNAAPTELTATAPTDDPGPPADGGGAAVPPTTAPTTPTPSPPPAPKACADAALRLTVAPRQPAYTVGQTPVLDLRVRNVSTLACVRDLGAALQEIMLYRGSQRLWSSNDCYPEGERDSQVLRPGAVESFSVTWSGLGSRPRCAGPRTRVGAGSYTLVGRLGSLVSGRAPIVLR
jgi:hypothetical protein